MWQIEFTKIPLIRHALAAERTRVETGLAARSYYHFKTRESELYIAYLRDFDPGPYPVTCSCAWPDMDQKTLVAILQVAATCPHAVAVYARQLLAAKDGRNQPIFPAARVDLRLARRIATALPENHPGRKDYRIKNSAPVFFYEPDEEEPALQEST